MHSKVKFVLSTKKKRIFAISLLVYILLFCYLQPNPHPQVLNMFSNFVSVKVCAKMSPQPAQVSMNSEKKWRSSDTDGIKVDNLSAKVVWISMWFVHIKLTCTTE